MVADPCYGGIKGFPMTPVFRPSTLTGRLGPALLLAVCAVRLAAADPAPGIHRLTLGRMEVTCLQDNQFELRASLLIGIGPEEARGQLERQRLSRPGFAHKNLGFSGRHAKGDIAEHIAFKEAERDPCEGYGRFVGRSAGHGAIGL